MPRIQVPLYSNSEWRARQFGQLMQSIGSFRQERSRARRERALKRLDTFLRSAEMFTPDQFARFAGQARGLFEEAGMPDAYEYLYETVWQNKQREREEEEEKERQKQDLMESSEGLLSAADEMRAASSFQGWQLPPGPPRLGTAQAFEQALGAMPPSEAVKAQAGMQARGLAIPQEQKAQLTARFHALMEAVDRGMMSPQEAREALLQEYDVAVNPTAQAQIEASREPRPAARLNSSKAGDALAKMELRVKDELGLYTDKETKGGSTKRIYKKVEIPSQLRTSFIKRLMQGNDAEVYGDLKHQLQRSAPSAVDIDTAGLATPSKAAAEDLRAYATKKRWTTTKMQDARAELALLEDLLGSRPPEKRDVVLRDFVRWIAEGNPPDANAFLREMKANAD